ncbi:hypothetical protein ES707_10317 [subsurface metagenome]
MKIRFYSIQDLYDEVQEIIVGGIVRMQFLRRTSTQEYRGGGTKSYVPMEENFMTLTVAIDDDICYFSQPFHSCMTYDVKDQLKEIKEKAEKVEATVRAIFKDWTIKKGVYEDES